MEIIKKLYQNQLLKKKLQLQNVKVKYKLQTKQSEQRQHLIKKTKKKKKILVHLHQIQIHPLLHLLPLHPQVQVQAHLHQIQILMMIRNKDPIRNHLLELQQKKAKIETKKKIVNNETKKGDKKEEKKTPKKEEKATSKKETPKKETSKKETPKKETPKKETKKDTKKDTKKKTTKSPSKKKSKDEPEEKSEKKGKKRKGVEEEEPEYKWWLDDPLPEGKKWKTLEHNGLLFPPSYVPHGVKMLYDGKPIELTPEAEELATYFSQYLETDHIKKPQFRKNFFSGFLKVLNENRKKKEEKHKIKDFSKCDFTPIHKHLMEQKEKKKARSKEEKLAEKEAKKLEDDKFGWAIVDGYKQKIANYRVEPPGLFLGRGDHPLCGILKKKVTPEDITLNLGTDAEVPECPIEGHSWGSIVHNDEAAWLAYWKDASDKFKYVWLDPSSRVKGQSDMKKFETARRLKDHIEEIRKVYTADLKSKDKKERQRATALYVIDHYALRVGNEKDEDEADTVGCCSLRKEHIKLSPPDKVEFDFLGKDSMRYHNVVSVPPIVFKNFELFMAGKKK